MTQNQTALQNNLKELRDGLSFFYYLFPEEVLNNNAFSDNSLSMQDTSQLLTENMQDAKINKCFTSTYSRAYILHM